MILSSQCFTNDNNSKLNIYTDYILDVRKIGRLSITTKMLDIEARVQIGWYLLASQSEHVPTRCLMLRWPTFRRASIDMIGLDI